MKNKLLFFCIMILAPLTTQSFVLYRPGKFTYAGGSVGAVGGFIYGLRSYYKDLEQYDKIPENDKPTKKPSPFSYIQASTLLGIIGGSFSTFAAENIFINAIELFDAKKAKNTEKVRIEEEEKEEEEEENKNKQEVPVDKKNGYKKKIPKHREEPIKDPCPICKEKIKNKLTTSCNHTFCTSCLQNLLQRSLSDAKCPCCMSQNFLSEKNLNKLDTFIPDLEFNCAICRQLKSLPSKMTSATPCCRKTACKQCVAKKNRGKIKCPCNK